jgi:hypothetical protein
MSLNQLDFRKAMGSFATGVTVITIDDGGEVHGMTANAFTSVSLDPMLVLFCVGKHSRTGVLMQNAQGFSVSILTAQQQALARFFAGSWKEPAPPAFRFIPWSGGPRLDGEVPAGGPGERGVLGAVKRLTVTMLGAVAGAYGERVRDHQEVLSHIADVIIDGYAIESALARTEKLAAAHSDRAGVAADMTSVFIGDAADRIVHSAKQVASALGDAGAATREQIAPIAAFPGVDTVATRRRIAEAVLQAGQHPL